MNESLEAELDALFQLPPAALVAARGALAERLKRAGDREAAARIKSIKRPAPAAWAINQVFFSQPALLEQALARADTVRALHASDGVETKVLSAAVEAQRAATQTVVDSALRLAEAAGQTTGAALQRRVLATLQGWLTGMGDEPPGRMTHELAAAGFAAVVSVGAPARPLPQAAGSRETIAAPALRGKKVASEATKARGAERAARIRKSRAHVAERERQVRDAEEQRRLLTAAEARGREALTRAQKAVQEAERALRERQREQQQQETQLQEVRRARAEAETTVESAEALLAQAREALELAGREAD